MNTKNCRLNGLKILNTRPVSDSKLLTKQIEEDGGIAIELPTIEIIPTNLKWLEKCNNFNKLNQIIFISKNAVRYFFIALEKDKIFLPKNVIITCIGPGTAEALKKYNFTANHIPQINTSENLLNLPNFTNVLGQNILLVKGIGGRNTIHRELIARGANLQDIEVYERKLPNINPNITQRLWQEDGIDIIIFTSKQAMLNTLALFPSQAKEWLLSKPSVVISERIAAHAKNLGFKNIINTSYANLLAAIQGQI